MFGNLQHQLQNKARIFAAFSKVTDESRDVNDVALLAMFTWGVTENINVREEFVKLDTLRMNCWYDNGPCQAETRLIKQ